VLDGVMGTESSPGSDLGIPILAREDRVPQVLIQAAESVVLRSQVAPESRHRSSRLHDRTSRTLRLGGDSLVKYDQCDLDRFTRLPFAGRLIGAPVDQFGRLARHRLSFEDRIGGRATDKPEELAGESGRHPFRWRRFRLLGDRGTQTGELISTGESTPDLGEGKEQPHQSIERFLLDLRPGFPARYRGFTHTEQVGEITLLQAQGLSVGSDRFGCQESHEAAKRIGDLIVRKIVEHHGPAVLAARDLEFGYLNRVPAAVILHFGRIGDRGPLDRLLTAPPATPGDGSSFVE
jgi:hypothetical protein